MGGVWRRTYAYIYGDCTNLGVDIGIFGADIDLTYGCDEYAADDDILPDLHHRTEFRLPAGTGGA